MAFQTGTQVDPRLMQADYSGFTNAANIQANAIAGLGKDIGDGIETYKKNKDITSMSLAQLEALGESNPDAYSALKNAGGDVSKSIANIEKGDYKQRDVLASLGAMQTYVTQRSNQEKAEQKSIMDAATLANLEAQTGLRKAQTATTGFTTPNPISANEIGNANEFLSSQGLEINGGIIYEKTGGFLGWGGSLTPVPNQGAFDSVKGVSQLRAMSAPGAGTVMMQPQEGWGIEESGPQGAPDKIGAALNSVAPKDPTISNRSAIRANRNPYEPMRYDAPERFIPGGRRGQR